MPPSSLLPRGRKDVTGGREKMEPVRSPGSRRAGRSASFLHPGEVNEASEAKRTRPTPAPVRGVVHWPPSLVLLALQQRLAVFEQVQLGQFLLQLLALGPLQRLADLLQEQFGEALAGPVQDLPGVGGG